jgi:hypothetical protein
VSSHHPFAKLRERMTQEQRAQADELYGEMVEAIPLAQLRRARLSRAPRLRKTKITLP